MRGAQVRVLGPVEVFGPNGGAVLVGARQRAVLALLALKAGTVVPRWRLVDALWGQEPPRTAIKSLHSHVARVRQALAGCGLPDVVVTKESGYALMLEADVVDAWRFEDCARRGHEALANGDVDGAVARLRDGLALWRHEVALADAEVTGWGAAEADRLSEVRLTAVEDWWDARLRQGGHDEAVRELERLLVAHPLRERMVALFMLALYRCDRHTTALDAYQRLRTRLADELGVDPGPELSRLHGMILRRDPGLDLVDDPHNVDPSMPRPAQLPARVGHFTGRNVELSTLDALLDDSEAQVAVITGPAGIGKTALAVQWAHRMAARFPDGQLFVDLHGLSAADALSHALRSLGVPGDRLPSGVAEQASLYRSLLHGRRMLVVIDSGATAEDVLPLVPASPGSLLLVTSRATLAALATHHAVCSVTLDVLARDEALTLLDKLLGAEVVRREPAAVAELARLCDRMPLALRIAAAKLAVTNRPVGELVGELSGANRLDALAVDGGSRSVRAVFASSYRSLSPAAARLFRLLGLHPGPTFAAPLAAAMMGARPAGARPVIDELANAHLILEVGAGRHRFHDLIALFAYQRAQAEESEAARDEAVARMLDWYLSIADAANRIVDPGRDRVTPSVRFPPGELPFPAQHHAALAYLDSERGNLLPIARFAVEHGDPAVAWQMTYLLTGFYDSRGHWRERVELCHWGIAAAQAGGDPATEGLMRSALGVACIATRQFDEALQSLYAALALMRAGDDLRGIGHVHNNIAVAYSGQRRFEEAVEAFRHALATHESSGHRLGIALARNNIGHTYARMGRPELSRPDLVRALAISREIGNPRLEAATLHSLGEAELFRGVPGEALKNFRQALAVYRRIGDRQYEAETLHGLGLAHLRRGDGDSAIRHLGRALTLTRQIADQHLEAVVRHGLGQAHLHRGDLPAAREQLRLSLALRTRVPDSYEEAHVHRDLGELAERSGDREGAEHHRALAVRLYQKVNAIEEADRLAARLP